MSLASRLAAVIATIGADVKTLFAQQRRGLVVADFGLTQQPSVQIEVACADVPAGALPVAFVAPVATPDHGLEEHLIEPLDCLVFGVVAGVGFSVLVRSVNVGVAGRWSIGWRL